MLLVVCSVFFKLDPTDVGSVRCASVCVLLVLERRGAAALESWRAGEACGSEFKIMGLYNRFWKRPFAAEIVRKTAQVYSRAPRCGRYRS